ncbi:MAG: HEAT repeat domain-containing protein [Methanosarcina sp.]|uniref:HEAT repeat domain-containing protein n=1 Tax=Methanosarcina sp. TaxID=2213 RepID=UPI002634D019|nr:HEAT repeat domain-containing protein [Methanosarcina sp.]MDD3248292.1 HEAT repeat domain-containing protein [Methanosarcina sp.]
MDVIWNRYTSDEDRGVRYRAASTLGCVYSHVPDKREAWKDLQRLVDDEKWDVRSKAAFAIGSAFSDIPDKQQAWKYLQRLINDEDRSVRFEVASTLGHVFFHVPDKQQLWNVLHRLTNDVDTSVRSRAAFAIGFAFSHVPDKRDAWNDLHRLINDEDWDVRYGAVSTFGSAFYYIPDKQQAWNDLHKLTNDEDWSVRSKAASTIGSAFSNIPDKQQAWNDLHKLTNDKNDFVRIYTNHSLGKVSIFKASQAEKEEDYKKELEKAIEFFEKSAGDSSSWSSPSEFCLPFYRSFHTIVFKKQEAKEQVDKYLEEAKKVIGDSKSKELLFEAVKNLGNALKEVQNLENTNLLATQDELNYYRQFCDRAAELMRETEETAPFATIALRKGLPILNRNLKELLEEIQKKTEVIHEQTKGTPFEELGHELSHSGQSLLQVRDPVGFKKQVQNLENQIACGHPTLKDGVC